MIWHEAGAFVEVPGNISPEWLGERLLSNGFRWCAPKLHDGLRVDNAGDFDGGNWINRLSATGVTVGGWGPLRENPEQEAQLAARIVTERRLAFYIGNAEYEYEFSGAGGGSNERAGRSGRFVAEFRRLHPALPLALSTFGRLDAHDLDWTPWQQAGAHFLPQAYPNEDASLTVPLCMAGARAALASPRLDLAAVTHPTTGVYPGPRGLVSPQEYVTQLQASDPKPRGFSVYLAERMAPDWWAVYGDAIRRGAILVGEPAPPPPPPPPPSPPPSGLTPVQRRDRAKVELNEAIKTYVAAGEPWPTIEDTRIWLADAVLHATEVKLRELRAMIKVTVGHWRPPS